MKENEVTARAPDFHFFHHLPHKLYLHTPSTNLIALIFVVYITFSVIGTIALHNMIMSSHVIFEIYKSHVRQTSFPTS